MLPIPEPLRMCSFHELHVETRSPPDPSSILERVVLPSLEEGFEAKVSLVEVLEGIDTVVYMIVYTSVSQALSHDKADRFKRAVEARAKRAGLQLRKAKIGGKPSVPIPHALLV